MSETVAAWWKWLGRARRGERQLQLCESLSLGEHRFVAVIRCQQQRFLVGGTGHSMALLAALPEIPETDNR